MKRSALSTGLKAAGIGLLGAFWLLTGCSGQDQAAQHLENARRYYAQGQHQASILELKSALQRNAAHPEARRLLGKLYVQESDGAAGEKVLLPLLTERPAPDLLIDLGRAFLQQEKYRPVLEHLRIDAHFSASDRVQLHTLRGEAYQGLNEVEAARGEYQAALRLEPDAQAPLLGLARLTGSLKQLAEMQELLERLSASAPGASEVWSLWGDLYRYQGDFERAEQAYTEAIAARSDSSRADYLNRALLRIAKADLKGAGEDIRVYRQWSAESPFGYFAEGVLAYQEGRYPEALALLSKALARKPDYKPTAFYLGSVEFALKQFEQAQQHLTNYLTYDPDSAEVRKKLAVIYQLQKNYPKAQAVLEPYLADDPDDLTALKLMADILAAQGNQKERAAILKKILEQNPEAVWAQTELGISLIDQGEWEQGLQILEGAQRSNPEVALLESARLFTLLRQSKLDEAIQQARAFIRQRPKEALLQSLLGVALLEKGHPDQARAVFEQALALSPDEPLASLGLAQLALAAGNPATARAHCEKVLTRRPGHLPALLTLAALEGAQHNQPGVRRWLEQALQANPTALQPRLQLALDHLRAGQPQRALELVQERAGAVHDALLLQVLGEAQLAAGQITPAVATFEKLIGLYPEFAHARFLLAKAYDAQGRKYNSQNALEEALRLNPEHLLAKVARMRQALLDGKTADALERLAELKRAYPTHPEVLAQEGWVAYQQGRYPQAAQILAAALPKLGDTNSEVAIMLAHSHWQAGEREQALQALTDWIAAHPDDRSARLALAGLYLEGERLAEAQRVYAEVVKRWPDEVIALNNLAELLRAADPAQAQKYAERALSLRSNDPLLMDTVAMTLLDQQRPERALVLLEWAQSSAPDNPLLQYHLALALSASGEKDRARRVLDGLLAKTEPFAQRQQAQSLRDSLIP